MTIASLDHAAIPIRDVAGMLDFYRRLGFATQSVERDGMEFHSVFFGDNRINFHAPSAWETGGFDLRGPTAVPGCGDFCFVWDGTLEDLSAFLDRLGVEPILGPVAMRGGRDEGRREGQSIYIRDPDENLLEFIVYP